MAVQKQTYKIVLVGDGGTGKTTFIKKILDGIFITEYNATCGADVSLVNFSTNYGIDLTFEVWDTAGQELKSKLSDAYYIGAHAAMIFYDVTSSITYTNFPHWQRRIVDVCFGETQIPIILCGNKVDCSNRKVKEKMIARTLKSGNLMYTEISAKTNYNFEMPFLALARKLTGKDDLTFVSNLNLKPADLPIDPKSVEDSNKFMQELAAVSENINLQDDEDFL
ncbi:hypothetical protein H312_02708 [Anncaliia algerae PRA339]|uniref:GTP-binding nuclear protein n=2 Tax=Opisthokonta TaxID=33154 RepID=A0A059EYU8_9MICR|nr:hypothetical protein H312_02708 [Anncaliia algerae PRA339]